MAILYDFYDLNEIQEENSEGKLRARAVSRGTITMDILLQRISDTSGFKQAEVKGIMSAVTDSVLHFLGKGYNVQLDELGFLSVSLTSRQVNHRREIRAESIKFNKLNFRASKKVRTYLTHVEKVKVNKRQEKKPVNLSHEERAQLLKDFLNTRPFATRADYCRITSTLRSKAIADINSFIREGWLMKYGSGRNIVYIKRIK